jgi:hypothetical protein
VPFNTVSTPAPSSGPLAYLAYAEETRGAAGLSPTGGIYQLSQQMWEQYAPTVGINTGLTPTPIAATGEEQRAVAAAIYNQYGFNPFIAAHPGIASRLEGSPRPQTVPIWGGLANLRELFQTPEGAYFDPFGVGGHKVPTTAVGSVGPNAKLSYDTGTSIAPGSVLTGGAGAARPPNVVNTSGGSFGGGGASDPFANIPSSYSQPGITPDQPQSSGLSGLAAGVLAPVVNWAEGHLVLSGLIVLVVGGFAAYHGLLGPKFETFVHRFA